MRTLDLFASDYQPKGLSVVIPNYNGINLLNKTLPPLHQALINLKIPWEVIIVDDASTDNSPAFIRQNFPWIKIIDKPENEGFSKTINLGIRLARYELVFLMNSDIILTTNYFKRQFRYFSQPDTFGVSGRIVGWEDEYIQDGARLPAFELFKLKISQHYIPKEHTPLPCYTLYLSGACALVSRDKLLQLNGFNELFSPFYAEDLELSVRAWRKGWKCYYDHDSICRHRVSSSIRAKSKKKYIKKIYYRNKLFFHGIHLPAFYLVGFLIQTISEALVRLLFFNTILLQALFQFTIYQHQWMHSRKSMANQPDILSLREIVNFIRRTVNNQKVIKFRSGKISAPVP